MFEYSFFQWLMFFYIYCVIGWCLESTIMSVDGKKLVNRGFLKGPMIPIYGFGALVILFVTLPVQGNALLVYLCGMAGTTALEYCTGFAMEKTFKMKYWDYSDEKYNFQGRICVTSSLFWGLLSLFLTDYLHEWIEKVILKMPAALMTTILSVVSVIFICDLIYSIKTAIDVNKMLEKMDGLRVQIALAKLEISDRVKQGESDASRAVYARLDKLKEDRAKLTSKLESFKNNFIAHPTAKSTKFNETFSELREKLIHRNK